MSDLAELSTTDETLTGPAAPPIRRFASWPDWPTARGALRRRYPADTVTTLRIGFQFAARWHGDQRRPDGQPYIGHLLETLEILIHSGQSVSRHIPHPLITALIHDVVEDTGCTGADVRSRFGSRIADQVEWLTQPDPGDGADRQAAREAYLARLGEAPLPVLAIKLADRYSNVQRLHTHPRPEARRSYYAETVGWFLPLAGRIPFYADLYTAWAEAYRDLGYAPEPQR